MTEQLSNINEVDQIAEYFKKNKLSIIKMNHQIDPTTDAEETSYHGYM